MAGIYIHIPFCKQACNYCNFFFSTSLYFKDACLAAIHQEIELRTSYLNNETIETIYFGGGTPSLLSAKEIEGILDTIYSNNTVIKNPEITLEANPDDLTVKKLTELASTKINRLSIGVQSFIERDLQFMKRAHNAKEAIQCIDFAHEVGFENISIDLIYGTPNLTDIEWLQNLQTATNFGIKHLSCYALTVEEHTPLFHEIRKGKTIAPKDKNAATHFEILMQFALDYNWEHYEISNLCKNGFESKHNASYWKNKKYVGIGPGAHSYNEKSRSWNISNLKKYIEAVNDGTPLFEEEVLTPNEKFNEFIMTGLRTSLGVDVKILENRFEEYIPHLWEQLKKQQPSLIDVNKSAIRLTNQGKFYADKIASDLFV